MITKITARDDDKNNNDEDNQQDDIDDHNNNDDNDKVNRDDDYQDYIRRTFQAMQVVNPTPRIALTNLPHHRNMHQCQRSWIFALWIGEPWQSNIGWCKAFPNIITNTN